MTLKRNSVFESVLVVKDMSVSCDAQIVYNKSEVRRSFNEQKTVIFYYDKGSTLS